MSGAAVNAANCGTLGEGIAFEPFVRRPDSGL
jgi:hypothetical protein